MEVFDKAYRDCEFVLGRSVLSAVGFDESFDFEPILAFTPIGRVRESVHCEGLADGT